MIGRALVTTAGGTANGAQLVRLISRAFEAMTRFASQFTEGMDSHSKAYVNADKVGEGFLMMKSSVVAGLHRIPASSSLIGLGIQPGQATMMGRPTDLHGVKRWFVYVVKMASALYPSFFSGACARLNVMTASGGQWDIWHYQVVEQRLVLALVYFCHQLHDDYGDPSADPGKGPLKLEDLLIIPDGAFPTAHSSEGRERTTVHNVSAAPAVALHGKLDVRESNPSPDQHIW